MDITDLEDFVARLSKKDKELFNRIYSTKTFTGRLKIVDDLKEFAKSKFGSIDTLHNCKQHSKV